MTHPSLGRIVWTDLTVDDAPGVRDFYRAVAGWSAAEVSLGDYADFEMRPGDGGEAVAGICHARGVNADLPPQWMVYIAVADVEESARRCREAGGEVVAGPREMGGGRICVIRDPAGAVCALFQPPDAG